MPSRKRVPWVEVQLLFQTSYDIRCNTHPFIRMAMLSTEISPVPALLGQGKSLPELDRGLSSSQEKIMREKESKEEKHV